MSAYRWLEEHLPGISAALLLLSIFFNRPASVVIAAVGLAVLLIDRIRHYRAVGVSKPGLSGYLFALCLVFLMVGLIVKHLEGHLMVGAAVVLFVASVGTARPATESRESRSTT